MVCDCEIESTSKVSKPGVFRIQKTHTTNKKCDMKKWYDSFGKVKAIRRNTQLHILSKPEVIPNNSGGKENWYIRFITLCISSFNIPEEEF